MKMNWPHRHVVMKRMTTAVILDFPERKAVSAWKTPRNTRNTMGNGLNTLIKTPIHRIILIKPQVKQHGNDQKVCKQLWRTRSLAQKVILTAVLNVIYQIPSLRKRKRKNPKRKKKTKEKNPFLPRKPKN